MEFPRSFRPRPFFPFRATACAAFFSFSYFLLFFGTFSKTNLRPGIVSAGSYHSSSFRRRWMKRREKNNRAQPFRNDGTGIATRRHGKVHARFVVSPLAFFRWENQLEENPRYTGNQFPVLILAKPGRIRQINQMPAFIKTRFKNLLSVYQSRSCGQNPYP